LHVFHGLPLTLEAKIHLKDSSKARNLKGTNQSSGRSQKDPETAKQAPMDRVARYDPCVYGLTCASLFSSLSLFQLLQILNVCNLGAKRLQKRLDCGIIFHAIKEILLGID
jgi:hypothetical protein